MNITYKMSKPICKGLAVLQHQVSAVPNIALDFVHNNSTVHNKTKCQIILDIKNIDCHHLL